MSVDRNVVPAEMRGMVLCGDRLSLDRLPVPQPMTGQVLAKVRAAGICGSDLHFAQHADYVRSLPHDEIGVLANADHRRGVVMGHEFAAEIAGSPGAARGWRPGTRVVSVPAVRAAVDGGTAEMIGYSNTYPRAFAEYIVMTEATLLRVPDHVSDEMAAMVEPCAVGLHAVRAASVGPNDRALIMGAGPIGLMTLLWLKQAGAADIAVSDPAGERRSLAAQLGATRTFDPRDEPVAAAHDVVFDCVGVRGTLQEAIGRAAERGRIVVVGVCMTEDHLRPFAAINKELTVRFVVVYADDEFAEALDAIASGLIDPAPLLTRTISLDELPDAFASLREPSDCKVVVKFD